MIFDSADSWDMPNCICFKAAVGLVVTAFKPQTPAITPTPELVLQGSLLTHSDIVFCVPSFVEVSSFIDRNMPSQLINAPLDTFQAWAKNPDDVRSLQKTSGVVSYIILSSRDRALALIVISSFMVVVRCLKLLEII